MPSLMSSYALGNSYAIGPRNFPIYGYAYGASLLSEKLCARATARARARGAETRESRVTSNDALARDTLYRNFYKTIYDTPNSSRTFETRVARGLAQSRELATSRPATDTVVRSQQRAEPAAPV